MIVKLLEFLGLKGGCTGSSESTHVKFHIAGNLMSRLNQKSEDEDEEEETERSRWTGPMEHILISFYLHLCQ